MGGSVRLDLLTLPPTTNNLFTVVEGRQVLSLAGRAFKRAAGAAATRAWARPAHEGPVALRITYHLGAHDRDADGSAKALIDALSGVVFRDDRQVVLLAVRKVRVRKGIMPYTTLLVRPLGAPPADHELHVPERAFGLRSSLIPPSTNNTYAISGNVRRMRPAARAVEARYAEAFADLAGGGAPYAGPMHLRFAYGFTADRRDVDGHSKLVIDAASGILWADDRQIQSVTLRKSRASSPRIELVGWALPDRPD